MPISFLGKGLECPLLEDEGRDVGVLCGVDALEEEDGVDDVRLPPLRVVVVVVVLVSERVMGGGTGAPTMMGVPTGDPNDARAGDGNAPPIDDDGSVGGAGPSAMAPPRWEPLALLP
mmetsp:Transcript_31180/g.75403  ORF Transcript_31180/g.75403 Transcript_31180/m.75403 type:complete len:117 (-) Transcript_31180:1347-1697(-)